MGAGVVCSFVIAFLVITIGLEFVFGLSGTIDIVSEPGKVDPGAVIMVGLYIVPIAIITYYLIKKTNYRILGITLCVSAPIMSFFIFVISSSTFWL